MNESFQNLSLSPELIEALQRENISVPTEIQNKSIPVLLKNKDLIAQSATGTGKTLAYLLPIFEKVKISQKMIQVIIMAPTHELVIQIQRQIERLALNSTYPVKSTPLIGNANIIRQIEKLKTKPQIVVGTPGRILELIQKNKIPARSVHTVVIDEADRLMDKNNDKAVLDIIHSTSKTRQLILFSATITLYTIDKAKALMTEPEIIKSDGPAKITGSVEHMFFIAEQRDKIETLRKLIRLIEPAKALVFLNKNDQIDNLIFKLKHHGFKAESIHGSDKSIDRKKIMNDFKTGKINIMIASDIAARGLQMDGVTHVFNMDLSEDPKDYLHRVGRTGRNGTDGTALSIVTEKELPLIRKIENTYKITIKRHILRNGEIHEVE